MELEIAYFTIVAFLIEESHCLVKITSARHIISNITDIWVDITKFWVDYISLKHEKDSFVLPTYCPKYRKVINLTKKLPKILKCKAVFLFSHLSVPATVRLNTFPYSK